VPKTSTRACALCSNQGLVGVLCPRHATAIAFDRITREQIYSAVSVTGPVTLVDPFGVTHRLDDAYSIGRERVAKLSIAHASVSFRHATLRAVRGGWCVSDLGSRNGTWVDGRPANEVTRLSPGAVIAFADVSFYFFPRSLAYSEVEPQASRTGPCSRDIISTRRPSSSRPRSSRSSNSWSSVDGVPWTSSSRTSHGTRSRT